MKSLIKPLFLIFISVNSFSQWAEQYSGVNVNLKSVSAIDNNNVWISGVGKVLKTTNGGLNWIILPSNGLPDYNDYINIFGINANSAIVIGYYSTAHFFAYRTSDGGLNWSEVLHVQDRFMDAVWMKNENEGIMIGDPFQYNPNSFTVKYTTNGGINWYDSFAPPGASFGDASYPNSLYLVGDNVWFGAVGSVKYSANYGNNWISQATGMDTYAIYFKNILTGMAGGLTGTSQSLKYTTNSGANWIDPANPGSGSVNGLACDGSTWWCSKSGTLIYKSTNNGANWVIDYTSPSGNNRHMSKARAGNRIWLIRTSGGIAMSEGLMRIIPISNDVPQSFSLSQNYPNPFNPATKIKFDILAVGQRHAFDTRLVIYDALGKEVAVLVNEHLSPGAYETEWDGSNCPSGVYFYKLTAGDYSETKKMILLK